jgi:RNA polymerase sigma-70 factor (ECF subfamily)
MEQALEQKLLRARDGDRAALSEILEEFQPGLLRMVNLRLEPLLRRRVEAEDIVQEALIEASRRFGEWCAQDRYPFRVWLRLVTAQALATAQRRHQGTQKRELKREVGLADERASVSAANVADVLVTSQTSPTQAAGREERRAIVLRALEELDDLDREILALRHFEDLSNEETAAELGIEPAAASKRFVRALQRLRPTLKALEPGA